MNPTQATWHDVEHSGYTADLQAWKSLILLSKRRRVLELGCGTGRVLHRIAPDCESVTGVDSSEQLLAALRSRTKPGCSLQTVLARAPELPPLPPQDLIIGPTLFIQLLNDQSERFQLLSWVLSQLEHNGSAAFAVADGLPSSDYEQTGIAPESSDRLTVCGTQLVSCITQLDSVNGVFSLHRSRSVNGVETETTRERLSTVAVDEICAEAAAVGLGLQRTIEVPHSTRHAGVRILVFNAAL